jgi:hypothetical protein
MERLLPLDMSLHEQGSMLQARNYEWKDVSTYAAEGQHIDMTRALLERGALPSFGAYTAAIEH